MPGSSCVDRGLSLVVLSCFHHGDKCQRQQRTVYESLCAMKLLPHGGQEAGREERTRQGQDTSFGGPRHPPQDLFPPAWSVVSSHSLHPVTKPEPC